MAKESKPTPEERLGFSKIYSFQHGTQLEVYLKGGQLQLFSASMEGACMPPALLPTRF